MKRRNRWLALTGMVLFALFPTSCASGVSGTAADFTLELGGGGTFALSEQTGPVLVIFWAEW